MQRLKVKGADIYISPLNGKPNQQWFTIRSGVQTCISNRQSGAVSGCPLPERTMNENSISDFHYSVHLAEIIVLPCHIINDNDPGA